MFKLLQKSQMDPSPILATTRLRDFHDYWAARCAEGVIPGRQHITPDEIPALLPHVVILDYANGQYRCRLAGTGVVEVLDQELTGRAIDTDLMGPAYPSWFRRLEAVRHRGRPLSGEENLWWLGRSHRHFHWLCLPLAGDGRHVDKLMLCIDWD